MSAAAGTAQVEVVLLGFPLPVFDRAREHMDGVMRELTFVAHGRRADGAHGVPERLLALIDEIVERYAGLNDAPESQRDAALERGDATVDLVFRVPVGSVPVIRHLGDLLDEVDGFCAEGEHLLSLVTPPEALAYRRWYLGEFLRQIQGQPPQAWRPGEWPWPVPDEPTPTRGAS